MRGITVGWLMASLVCLSACQGAKQLVGTLGDLQTVQREVVKATGHGNVTVNLHNNRHLSVGMVNSPFGALPEEARRAKARQIAGVAYRTLPSRATLESVAVSFVVHRRYLLFFNYTNALDSFAFTVKELAPELPATEA